MSATGILYVIATPLGNPLDLSPRAVATLRLVDVLFAEDTRTARALLATHGIDKPAHSCFDANEAVRAEEAAQLLGEGRSIGLVSEAGTPALSDPGYRVVRSAIAVGARVVPIPGPSALLSALVASGLPPDRFLFAGFPPRKAGARRALFQRYRDLPATLVFYESPHRVAETLSDLAATLGGERPACLARELTKVHEELVRGTLDELARRYAGGRPLGEVTLVVGGAADGVEASSLSDAELDRQATLQLASGMSARDVAAQLTAQLGRPRREIYQRVMALQRGMPPSEQQGPLDVDVEDV